MRFISAALIVLIALHGARAQDASTTAPADVLWAAQSAMTQLDQIRVVGATDPLRVLDLLKRGTDALAGARAQVPEAVHVPSTAPAGRTRRSDPAQSAANAQRRLALCQIAFMQAELHRRAGAALPADHAERAAQLDQALALCKTLRIDYRDLVAGRLGYAGEARVHRAKGDLVQADAVLAPVVIELDERRLVQQPPAVLQVQRVLWLERVETALARNPKAGSALATDLAKSALIKDATPAEKAALTWLTVQSAANVLIGSGEGDVAKIAAQLRDPPLAAGAPDHQRIALLVKLAQREKGLLTAAEQTQWARLQSSAGMQEEALETYAAAAAANPQDVSPADWHAYGSLLYATGKLDAAADALSRGLESLPADSPQRLGIIRAIAVGRLKVAREAGADDAKRKAAIDALWQLAEAAQDSAVRRDALRSWAHFHQQAGTFDQQMTALAKFQEDVSADPYLCLLASQARWRAAQPAGGPATQPAASQLAALADEIRTNLTRLLPQADADLAPSLVLMIAQATTATPGGARAALDVLAKHEANLKADAPATPQIMALKLRLLMELGLTAEAESLASRMTTSGALPSETALRLADMLADRYAGADAAPPPQARDQVVQFVARGLASHPHDAGYRDAALAGVRTLLKMKAYSDAQQILAGIKPSGADKEKDPTPALLMAQALQGQGKVEDAQRTLDDVTRDNPEAGDVHLAMGRLQQQLQQWEKSAAAYRSARKQLPVGRDAWWQATVGLADALAQQGNVAGAQELLRVANSMYRNRAPVSLLPRIDALLKQPVGTVNSRNGRNG